MFVQLKSNKRQDTEETSDKSLRQKKKNITNDKQLFWSKEQATTTIK